MGIRDESTDVGKRLWEAVDRAAERAPTWIKRKVNGLWTCSCPAFHLASQEECGICGDEAPPTPCAPGCSYREDPAPDDPVDEFVHSPDCPNWDGGEAQESSGTHACLYRVRLMELVRQIEVGDYRDEIGHKLKNNRAYLEAQKALGRDVEADNG